MQHIILIGKVCNLLSLVLTTKFSTMRKLMTIISVFLFCQGTQAQSLSVNAFRVHIASCDNQSGILRASPNGGDGNYTFLWSTGETADTIYGLGAGDYWVTVYSDGDSAVGLRTLDPFGVGNVNAVNVCSGDLGYIQLQDRSLNNPVDYSWYLDNTLLSTNHYNHTNAVAGNYHWSLIDAEGCIDSGSVTLVESNPIMEVTLADSSLCYQRETQLWYTPGFTFSDLWGNSYNSTTDTLTYWNDAFVENVIPVDVMDEHGCSPPEVDLPWVYLEPYYQEFYMYQIADTLSLNYNVDTAAHPTSSFRWHSFWDTIAITPYQYITIDSSGTYGAIETNQYGCTNGGSIDAVLTGINEPAEAQILSVHPNPLRDGDTWRIEFSSTSSAVPINLMDAQGRLIRQESIQSSRPFIKAPDEPGIYFLQVGTDVHTLIRQ